MCNELFYAAQANALARAFDKKQQPHERLSIWRDHLPDRRRCVVLWRWRWSAHPSGISVSQSGLVWASGSARGCHGREHLAPMVAPTAHCVVLLHSAGYRRQNGGS